MAYFLHHTNDEILFLDFIEFHSLVVLQDLAYAILGSGRLLSALPE